VTKPQTISQDHTARIAEQRGVAEPGSFDADMPTGKIEREDDAGGKKDQPVLAWIAAQRFLPAPRKQCEEGQGQGQPPEPRRNRAAIGDAHEPRTQRKSNVSCQQCKEMLGSGTN
jgi:hypothetical protein